MMWSEIKNSIVFFRGFAGRSSLQGLPGLGISFAGSEKKNTQNPIGLLNPFFEITISVAEICIYIYYNIPSGHFNIAMERSTMFKFGIPSISMGHLYHGYVKKPDGIYIYIYIPKDPNPSNVGAFKLRPRSENTFVLITPQLLLLSLKEYISTTKTSWGLELGYKFAQVAMRSCFQVTK